MVRCAVAAKCLRTGRGLRQPNRQGAHRKSRVLPDMINVAERPAEADDRAVPGLLKSYGGGPDHRQGQRQRDRHPGGTHHRLHDVGAPARGYKPAQVAPALAAKIQTLPSALRGSLTWDQGVEMRDWKQVRMATEMAIFFCDPHSPWQRGTNENTVSVGDGPVGLFSQAGAGSSR